MSVPAAEAAPAPALKNFAFHEDLVRVVPIERRPWFVAADVCRALQIKNVSRAVDRLPSGARTLHTVKGERSLNIISEGGLYRLVFTSRTPQAEEFVAWVADEVLPAIRENGFYGATQSAPTQHDPLPAGGPDADPRAWPVIQKLQCVQLAARIHGRARAEPLWRQLGLPPVPPPPMTSLDEARICLRHLLDAPVYVGSDEIIRETVEAALEDDEGARALLIPAGIKVLADRDGLLVANSHPRLVCIFAGTEWQRSYGRVLRRLPGVLAGGTGRFEGRNFRGTFVPAALLDDPS